MVKKAAKAKKKAGGGKKSARKKSKSTGSSKRKAVKKTTKKTSAGKVRLKRVKVDPQVALAMKRYAEAVANFNRGAYRKAKELFQRVQSGASGDLAERAGVYIAMCDQRLEGESQNRLRSADDHYDFAVAQINAGNLVDARDHLKKAAKIGPEADYVLYALAAVSALSNQPDEALAYLEGAIRLRPESRFQARNDEDFASLHSDLGFQQMVFPERFPTAGNR